MSEDAGAPARWERLARWIPSKRTLQTVGFLLQLLSFAFLAYVFHKNFNRLAESSADLDDLWQVLCLLVIVSLGMVSMLVVGWRELLIGAGAQDVKLKNVFWVIGRTAIAKYIPGNVFQYVGRQLFASTLGATQAAIFAGTLGEILIVASLSCAFAAAALPFAVIPHSAAAFRVPALCVIALGALSPVIAWILGPKLSQLKPFRILQPMLRIDFVSWLRAYLAYAACFAVGLAAFLLAAWYFLGHLGDSGLLTLTAAYSVSYAFGFMMPGAPGGLGVREALIVLIGGAQFDQSLLAAAALVQRLGNIMAEVVAFGISFGISRGVPQASARNESAR